MNAKPIQEYNKQALIDIEKHLEFSEYSNSQVTKRITYVDFVDIVDDLTTILTAIEVIGFQGSNQDLGTCAGLSQIARKMLPRNEMDFLDSLLIKKEGNKEIFSKIDTLKQ
ncbi:hypothetical protein FNW52_02955 [Flavobacterium sp. ZT3R18]|uniref:hypothetical protein n=1 Tax=Flavobacterium sp. ZT3R18 TaxID=2594429 RepID=UPI001179A3FC|nr:hypothetical protein [Flavobacterium sp. ZT3R18]TRX37874.1 hypothetical protein FNW52_02955 [Flavobacterium sp. ZT3R18]